jgi:hypothetical protein
MLLCYMPLRCHYAETCKLALYAECRYAECHYAEYRGADHNALSAFLRFFPPKYKVQNAADLKNGPFLSDM